MFFQILFFLFLNFLIKEIKSISFETFSKAFKNQIDSEFPIIKTIYTLNNFPCAFPFNYQNKIYYECAPEFRFLKNNTSKILLFWCFYLDPVKLIYNKDYCKSEESESQDVSNDLPYTHDQILKFEETINKIHAYNVLKDIYQTLDKSLTSQYFDKCSNFSLNSIINVDLTCLKTTFVLLISEGKIEETLQNQFACRFEALNNEILVKKQKALEIKTSYEQYRFLSRDLLKSTKPLLAFSIFKLSEQRFKDFYNEIKETEKNCNINCFEYIIRVLNGMFSRFEIQRIKMEVYAKLQGFWNISRLLDEEKDCMSNKIDCSFDKNEFEIEDINFHWRYWTDKTLINKIFRLIFNDELSFSEIYNKKYQLAEKKGNFYGDYEQIEDINEEIHDEFKSILKEGDELLDILQLKYQIFEEKVKEIERNISNILSIFEEFPNKTLPNITAGISEILALLSASKEAEKNLSETEVLVSEAKTRYYEKVEQENNEFYEYLPITINWFQIPVIFCRTGPQVFFKAYSKSMNFKGPFQIGHLIMPIFDFDSTGPLSLKMGFGIKPEKTDNYVFKVMGSDDNIKLSINRRNIKLELDTEENSWITHNNLSLIEDEIYEISLEIRRKNKNILGKYKIEIMWKDGFSDDFREFECDELCATVENSRIYCEKLCKAQFYDCFYQGFWKHDDCVNTCEFHHWDYSTLLCLKDLIEQKRLCNSSLSFSYSFRFCLLSGDFQLLEAFSSDVWQIKTNEFSQITNINMTNYNEDYSKEDYKFDEKPIIYSTGDKTRYLMIDPIYLEFEARILKLYPLKSHQINQNKPFLFYPANKQRKSPILTVFTPEFSENDQNSSSFQSMASKNIIFMEDFSGNEVFVIAHGGALIYKKVHNFCRPPKISNEKTDYFQKNSQVFLDLDYYFVKFPHFLQDFFLIKTRGYSLEPLKIHPLEPIEVFIALEVSEYFQHKPIIEDLEFIEKMTKKGWTMIPEPFNIENLIIISNLPQDIELENRNITQCYWDDRENQQMCKDYKFSYEKDKEKRFILWKNSLFVGDSIDIHDGFFQMIIFVKAIDCEVDESFCSEGDEILKEVDTSFVGDNEEFFEKTTENIDQQDDLQKKIMKNIEPLIEIKTNLNDCVWGLDESGKLYYRKLIQEDNRIGKL